MICKLLPVILVAGLTACASSGTHNASNMGTSSGSDTSADSADLSICDAQSVQSLLGKKYSEFLDRDLKSGAHASQLRVLKPGHLMTMEYNPARLNVIVESDGSISALRCG